MQALKAGAARRAQPRSPSSAATTFPDNGERVRGLILDFAARIDPDLAEWIAAEVAFPASMVDRITPAPGPHVRKAAEQALGCEDRAAIDDRNVQRNGLSRTTSLPGGPHGKPAARFSFPTSLPTSG